MKISRRAFLLSTTTLPFVGTLAPHRADGTPAPPTSADQEIRLPQPDQWWRYVKRDAITGKVLETQIERVQEIGPSVAVQRQYEVVPRDPPSSWSSKWLKSRQDQRKGDGELPNEVQQPWGRILVDPHWDLLQVYKTPIPLWPTELRPGWRAFINTKYKTPLDDTERSWQQTMRAHEWTKISVPAGQFTALRYTNVINFTHQDFGRTASVREESLWLVPALGRWVARHSTGTYYLENSVIDTPFNEDNIRWELLDWG